MKITRIVRFVMVKLQPKQLPEVVSVWKPNTAAVVSGGISKAGLHNEPNQKS